MADEDVADRATGNGADQGVIMRVIIRAGVDDSQRIGADDIAVGAVKGESARIIDGEAQNAFTQFNRFPILGRETAVENKRHGSGFPFFFGLIDETA